MNRREIEATAVAVVTKVLDELGGSGWRDEYPEAYVKLVSAAARIRRIAEEAIADELLKRSQIR